MTCDDDAGVSPPSIPSIPGGVIHHTHTSLAARQVQRFKTPFCDTALTLYTTKTPNEQARGWSQDGPAEGGRKRPRAWCIIVKGLVLV